MQNKWQKLKAVNHRFQLVRWIIVFVLFIFLSASVFLVAQAKLANVGNLANQLAKPTLIYDKDGNQAGQLADQKGQTVALSAISPNLKNAVLSTEDREFYREPGFSVKGLSRALVLFAWNKLSGKNYISGGGSTITQQLAKNAYLGQQQTFNRKFKELFLAIEIEKHYSKDQILAMYLNSSYFGHNIYGVADAAQGYFGVSVSQLSVSQAASIAGMLANPTIYDPTRYPDLATNRRNTVLQNMVANRKLSQADADLAQKQPLGAKNPSVNHATNYQYPWFFDAVINEAINKYHLTETEVMNRGYRIYTTLDQTDQRDLQMDYANAALFPIADDQSASIALDARTGGVLAVVGGRGEHVFRGFNRAVQARRSPGSLIKPLVVYAPALSRGFQPSSLFPNQVMTFPGKYRPENALGYQSADVDMPTAIAHSYNIPAVYLLNKIGVKTGYAYAKKFGLPVQKSDENLALALGGMSQGVSPQQMAQAYTAFANRGRMSQAHYITRILDASGKVVVGHPDVSQKQIISASDASQMTNMMFRVYQTGTGAGAAPVNYRVAGKTGTTEDVDNTGIPNASKDLWAAAYTPDIVTVSWQGYDISSSGKTLPVLLNQSLGPLFQAQTTQFIANSPKTPFGEPGAESWTDQVLAFFNRIGQSAKQFGKKINDFGQNLSQFIQEQFNR
ncbi:transglycosylase domain-containing protein [Oenococcus kitaharae]|uniref:transglycosylase domain-containing protein n=1 Tax=Oenococcus TaxID=46254 RepID=UPI0021E77375|nr:PBP1A family penicillin-binding protein [Oenococcus kitaharae]MCV3295700.1 PBP1A family penicillin-binding protein [Oenococcus kitaharae]